VKKDIAALFSVPLLPEANHPGRTLEALISNNSNHPNLDRQMDRHQTIFSNSPSHRTSTPPRGGEPEDYYMTGAPRHLPAIEPHLYTHSDTNDVSPVDSNAPIMERSDTKDTSGSGYKYPVGTATSTPPPPPPPAFLPPPVTTPQDALFPMAAPTQYTYPPVSSFQPTSMGVVNGEVGATPHTTQVPHTPYTPVSPASPGDHYRYPAAPLSAGLPKTPGTAKEEARVKELEDKAIAEDRKDLAIKLKVRFAKVFLRSINCACSLVVLALVASTFAIFYSTKNLATRNNFRPWAMETPQWPQICILVIACISLILSFTIMYGYWRGGHSRAERMALRATIFAGGVFIFTIIIWSIGIGIMQGSRGNNQDQDIWGWACKDNQRKALFKDTINYDLVCKQQDWVVVCAIIEISVETLAIAVYLFAFYRLFYTKRRLRKSMQVRDEARSSLWLAKLQEQRDLEEGNSPTDTETAKNTALNQLNGTQATTVYASEPKDGHVVPVLAAPPKRFGKKNVPPALSMPPPAVANRTVRASVLGDVPQTGRSVRFGPEVDAVRPSSREKTGSPDRS